MFVPLICTICNDFVALVDVCKSQITSDWDLFCKGDKYTKVKGACQPNEESGLIERLCECCTCGCL